VTHDEALEALQRAVTRLGTGDLAALARAAARLAAGRRWPRLPPADPAETSRRRRAHCGNGHASPLAGRLPELLERAARGESTRALGRAFGASHVAVARALRRAREAP